MTDFVIILILVLVIGSAVFYLRKEKKRGVRCVGCPDSGCCSCESSEGTGCGCHTEEKE